jgi:hypothetical protein
MITLSAAQAISPAIERTKYFLFKPFRLGRFLKLTLVALLTEGGMASCNFSKNIPSGNGGGSSHPIPPFHMPHLPQTHEAWMPILIGIVVFAVLIAIPLILLISYLLIRLRFSYFDCVLRMQDRIGPAWARYHRQAMRYLGMAICVGLAFWVAIALAGYGIYDHFKPLIQSLGSENRPGWIAFLPLIGVVFLVLSLLGIAAALVNIALGSFVLPHMALEDASIGDALSDVWSDFVAEPWQYVFFVLLRFLTTLAASIIAVIGLIIPLVVVVAIGAVIVIILKTVSTGLAVLLGVPAGLLILALFFLAGIGVSGTIGTYRRNYAILFYGGRYPPMGNLLQAPVAPQPPAWPASMPPGGWSSGG